MKEEVQYHEINCQDLVLHNLKHRKKPFFFSARTVGGSPDCARLVRSFRCSVGVGASGEAIQYPKPELISWYSALRIGDVVKKKTWITEPAEGGAARARCRDRGLDARSIHIPALAAGEPGRSWRLNRLAPRLDTAAIRRHGRQWTREELAAGRNRWKGSEGMPTTKRLNSSEWA